MRRIVRRARVRAGIAQRPPPPPPPPRPVVVVVAPPPPPRPVVPGAPAGAPVVPAAGPTGTTGTMTEPPGEGAGGFGACGGGCWPCAPGAVTGGISSSGTP